MAKQPRNMCSDKAIIEHGKWKQNLGKNQRQNIKTDTECDFGKWLYSLDDSEKKSKEFNKIQKLHSEFHQSVFDGFNSNNFDKAYTLSKNLISDMMDWYWIKRNTQE